MSMDFSEVRQPATQSKPSLPAAVIRNFFPVAANLNTITADVAVGAVLTLVGFGVYVAIGISIADSPTRQGFHDRLAGGTFVIRRGKTSYPVPER